MQVFGAMLLAALEVTLVKDPIRGRERCNPLLAQLCNVLKLVWRWLQHEAERATAGSLCVGVAQEGSKQPRHADRALVFLERYSSFGPLFRAQLLAHDVAFQVAQFLIQNHTWLKQCSGDVRCG
jgi:hypothetical protein